MRKFLPTSGLAFKTFAFALILMTAVMVMTLGILYRFLPGYYFTHMTNQLDRNAASLIQEITRNPDTVDARPHIIEFSAVNNAIVLAFNENEQPLAEFSSFFTSPPQVMLNMVSITDSNMNLTEIPTVFRVYNSSSGIPIIPRVGGSDIPFIPFNFDLVPRVDYWSFLPANDVHDSYVNDMQDVYLTISAHGGGFIVSDDRHRSVSLVRAVNHPEIATMIFSSTLQPIDQARAVILAMIPYLMAAGFVIALIVAFIFSRYLTKPIIKIADAATEMRQMTPGVVSGINSNDEVGRLSNALDKLYQDLCSNIQGLQAEMDKTARLERSKTDLMHAAGHELKTPISALSGMIDGMIDKVGAYKNHEKYLPELKSQTERLSKLVNEILMASQTEDTGNSIEITSVDIDVLVNETVEQYMPLIEKKGLHLNITSIKGFSYKTDRRVLSIALSNLLSNAVKYTPDRGNVKIGMETNQKGTVLFVENQCPSVDQSLMPKWFEPFYTPDYSRDKSKVGTGLGLYIVKKNLDNLDLPFEIAAVDDGVRFEIIFT